MNRFLLVLFVLLAGCEPAPIEVYESVQLAAEQNDREQFMAFLDVKSRGIYEELQNVQKSTSNRLHYRLRLDDLANWGEPLAEEIDGSRAILKVGDERKPQTLFFRLEDGSWKLDGTRLPGFWSRE